MARMGFLLEKEFKQFIRNALLPKLVIMFPILVMLIMPWVATMEVTDVAVTVVDNDRTQLSRRLSDKIAASGYFDMQPDAASYSAGEQAISAGRADIVIEIPQGMERDIESGNNVALQISANAVDGTKGSIGSNYLVTIINDFVDELRAGRGESMVSPGRLSVLYLYNPTLNYRFFMIPALMIILVITIGGFLPALNIVSEKEIGTIEQINVSPVSKWEFILAKLIPYWIMGIVIFSLALLLAYWIYGLSPAGSLLTIYLAALLFTIVMSGVGLIVSNYSSTMQQSMFIMFFFAVLFILMSGLFTPVESMPGWAQCIAALLPPRYFIEILRAVYLKGSGMAELYGQFLCLAGFALLLSTWAVLSYQKRG